MLPTGKTQLLCLLGHPVCHSNSPLMHNTACQALNLDYSYMAFDIKEEDTEAAVNALKLMNCRGFNLTMPLKHSIIPFLDEISDAARISESVNTVLIEDGRLKGYTTDGLGFMMALADNDIEYKEKTITVLGAGGAATSVITEAAIEGVKEIFIFKRKNATFPKVVDYAEKVSESTGCRVSVHDMEDMSDMKDCLQKSDILINGTNVGMGDDDRSLVPKELLYKDLIVTDVIYHPEVTRLLKDAAEVGCKTMNGKYMLLFQGAAAFKIWTGQEMPIDLIKKECFQ